MKAYTYLVINKLNKKWYYGVRYAKNCSTSDLGNTYFTSCKLIQEEVKKYGKDLFYWIIRKTFDDIQSALEWEQTVLRRMKVTKNPLSYNQHSRMGFTVKYGENNPSKNLEVRAKISNFMKSDKNPLHDKGVRTKALDTRLKKEIIKICFYDKFVINGQKINIKRYEKYKNYLIDNKSKCKLMIKKLDNIINLCKNYTRKSYPKNRKKRSLPHAVKHKGGVGKGWKAYTSPDLQQMKWIKPDENPPINWIRGAKTKNRTEKISNFLKTRKHSQKTKDKMRFSRLLRIKNEKNQKNNFVGENNSL